METLSTQKTIKSCEKRSKRVTKCYAILTSISNQTYTTVKTLKVESKQWGKFIMKIQMYISKKITNRIKEVIKWVIVFICRNFTAKEFPETFYQIQIRWIRRQENQIDISWLFCLKLLLRRSLTWLENSHVCCWRQYWSQSQNQH